MVVVVSGVRANFVTDMQPSAGYSEAVARDEGFHRHIAGIYKSIPAPITESPGVMANVGATTAEESVTFTLCLKPTAPASAVEMVIVEPQRNYRKSGRFM